TGSETVDPTSQGWPTGVGVFARGARIQLLVLIENRPWQNQGASRTGDVPIGRTRQSITNQSALIMVRGVLFDRYELQVDLDSSIEEYNEARPNQARWCFGKTRIQTFFGCSAVWQSRLLHMVSI